MLEIDGSFGEGGGQILRSSLALAITTGRAVRLSNIRAGRPKPGLMRQHLTAVSAAAAVSGGRVSGAAVGSTELTFEPGAAVPGDYEFAIGTAGSTTLVLQTILPALLTVDGSSRVVLCGGTHNPLAPPFEFLARTFLPLVNRMGPRVEAVLERAGFAPGGGGRLRIEITPAKQLAGFDLPTRGPITHRSAQAIVANLSHNIGDRQRKAVHERLGWDKSLTKVVELRDVAGPGNVLLIELGSEFLTEVISGFGSRGVTAEKVAEDAIAAAGRYLSADVPVGEYLADQLLLPLALAGRGSFRTLPLSLHAETHIELIRKFLEVRVTTEPDGEGTQLVCIG
ncbi:MAG: RNA 3'-terminal phosphate cyclase [Planctomycetales bacterium]|nr:RNA 3'-terminal phosphate cyclase [Planctomycetales bacterium]